MGFPAGMTPEELIAAAWRVRENAYAPYSKFQVGAAIWSEGRLFIGCNVENLSYGLTICAERVAASAMAAAGCRTVERIAVVADTAVPVTPCGACRQFLAEFGDPVVILANREGTMSFPLHELLPRSSAGILDRPED